MKPFELLTVKQVAGLFKVHRNTIYRRVKSGEFPPPFKVLGRPRWKAEDINAYLTRHYNLSKP